jgi:putative transposase
MACKYCQSDKVIKFGTYKGVQRYFCKSCKRKFKADDTLFHMKRPADYISSAMNMYYTGMSIGDISKFLKQQYDYEPSTSVVFNWVNKYTDWVVDRFRNDKPNVGDVWIADETMLDIDGHKIWFWDILDTKTRYLLASRVSEVRTSQDAELLMQAAYKRAGKAPRQVLTDHLKAYLDGIEMTFGSDTEHVQSKPFTSTDSTSMIERFHNTLKDRTKVMRGFRDIETLMRFTDGFLAYYNYFRPHEALNNKTPAEVTGLSTEVKNWADVCRLPVSKVQEIKTHKEPIIRVHKVHRPVVYKKRKPYKRKPTLADTGITVTTMRRAR